MATAATQPGMKAGKREGRLVVIKHRPCPGRGRMACVARVGKTRLLMIWVVGVLIIRHVAGRASPARQVVISVLVALRTSQGNVGSGQSKPCARMIERCVPPRVRVVA